MQAQGEQGAAREQTWPMASQPRDPGPHRPCPTPYVTVSGSRCTSMKAEYSRSRSREEAMVRSCHTGTEAAAEGSGARGS